MQPVVESRPLHLDIIKTFGRFSLVKLRGLNNYYNQTITNCDELFKRIFMLYLESFMLKESKSWTQPYQMLYFELGHQCDPEKSLQRFKRVIEKKPAFSKDPKKNEIFTKYMENLKMEFLCEITQSYVKKFRSKFLSEKTPSYAEKFPSQFLSGITPLIEEALDSPSIVIERKASNMFRGTGEGIGFSNCFFEKYRHYNLESLYASCPEMDKLEIANLFREAHSGNILKAADMALKLSSLAIRNMVLAKLASFAAQNGLRLSCIPILKSIEYSSYERLIFSAHKVVVDILFNETKYVGSFI